VAEGDGLQLGGQRVFPGVELPVRRGRDGCGWDDVLIDGGVEWVLGDISIGGEGAELVDWDGVVAWGIGAGDEVGFAVGHGSGVVIEVQIDGAVGGLADILAIGVVADADEGVDEIRASIEAVEAFQSVVDPFIGVNGEDGVEVAIDEEEGAGSDESGDAGPGPLEGIVEKHAVAVTVDDAVTHVGGEVGHAADGDGEGDAFVGGGDPERGGSAATDAGDGDAGGVDVGAADEVIDGSDAVEAFDSGGGVTAGVPPPAVFAVGAVVDGGDLTQLESIQDEADIAVSGEPDTVGLVGGFVAGAALEGVTADIEHGGEPLSGVGIGGAEEVGGDVEPGARLEVEILDQVTVALDGAGNRGVERSGLGQGVEAEHMEILSVAGGAD